MDASMANMSRERIDRWNGTGSFGSIDERIICVVEQKLYH